MIVGPTIHLALTLENFPSVRSFRAAMTKANSAAGDYWHEHILPRHFTREARHRYHHKPRTSKYLARKQGMAFAGRQIQGHGIKYGGQIDNVLTGRGEDALRAGATTRAYPTRVTISMVGPYYMTMRPFRSNQPNKGAEVTFVSGDEVLELAEVMNFELQEALNEIRGRESVA